MYIGAEFAAETVEVLRASAWRWSSSVLVRMVTLSAGYA